MTLTIRLDRHSPAGVADAKPVIRSPPGGIMFDKIMYDSRFGALFLVLMLALGGVCAIFFGSAA